MIEGKTKRLVSGDTPDTIRLVAKDVLTAGNGVKQTHISAIGAEKTQQAADVFALLNRANIPTAFHRKEGDDTLYCDACTMLPIECVLRRYAWGSYLKRNPAVARADGMPHRFDSPVVELFHKYSVVLPPLVDTAQLFEEGEVRDRFGAQVFGSGAYADPYIDYKNGMWHLHDAGAPIENNALFSIDPLFDDATYRTLVDTLLLPAFTTLETAWAQAEKGGRVITLADIKIEVGRRTRDNALVIADVIDNDSWRVWIDADPAQQLDKQNYRDGSSDDAVAAFYRRVSGYTATFAQAQL